MDKNINVDIESAIERETLSKVFARMCQLLESKGGVVKIPFADYDHIEEGLGEQDKIPAFFSSESRGNIMVMNILEKYLSEQYGDTEVTNIDDLMGAVINYSLCEGKQLQSYEDKEEGYVVIKIAQL